MNSFSKKKIVFITGTRADYGKMKSLMLTLEADDSFEVYVFVCGMHLSKNLGSTYEEVLKDRYKNVHVAFGLSQGSDTSVNLGNTVSYLSGYINFIEPDMIIVHGDRVDALAGAIVGALHNIIVGHIEGGELSGTIDESIRHAISKFAHVHFVCTSDARDRLIQLGEEKSRIFIIGSPDIDIMMSDKLPTLDIVRSRYDISFDRYAIFMYHPVTTEHNKLARNIREIISALIESHKNYVVVYPNNDLGSDIILSEYDGIKDKPGFRLFPSIRFEYFLTLMKHSEFIIGNSSAGIREAGIYGIPAIDIGTRQNGRYSMATSPNIVHVNEDKTDIMKAICDIEHHATANQIFGDGNSTQKFYEIMKSDSLWGTGIQKHFVDYGE